MRGTNFFTGGNRVNGERTRAQNGVLEYWSIGVMGVGVEGGEKK